jgi:hypothetical protein
MGKFFKQSAPQVSLLICMIIKYIQITNQERYETASFLSNLKTAYNQEAWLCTFTLPDEFSGITMVQGTLYMHAPESMAGGLGFYQYCFSAMMEFPLKCETSLKCCSFL